MTRVPIPGLRVGHWTNARAMTGCTVVLPPPGTLGSGEVRGGAPGTRETDLLRPGTLVEEINAVMVTGGSAFGLAAADGVVGWLEERGVGFDTGVARVPIVPAAVVFDLGVGDPSVRPGPSEGYAACQAASEEVGVGRVGAGTGATVAKLHGPARAVPGGLGTAEVREGSTTVWTLAVVNALGEIVDDDGEVLVGALPEEAPGPEPTLWPGAQRGPNTTVAVVVTEARLTKERAHLLAGAGQDGLARAVRPAHTMWDGDTVFLLATGTTDAPQPELERMVERAVAEAIRAAVRPAEPGQDAGGRSDQEDQGRDRP